MLRLKIKPKEFWDEENERFVTNNSEQTLQLEHSLVSISKWESKWCVPFLGKKNDIKTPRQTMDYIKCMTITQNVKDEVYQNLSASDIAAIEDYIDQPMTATTFNEINSGKSKEIITSELIYYWMVSLQIPMECQRWHLNRLLTLIRVCNVKNGPAKKMNKKELASKYASLNAARRQQLKTNG